MVARERLRGKASTPSFSSLADLQPLPQQSGSPASNGLVGEEVLGFEKKITGFSNMHQKKIDKWQPSALKRFMWPGIPFATPGSPNRPQRIPLCRRSAPPEVPNVAPQRPHSSWAPGHQAGLRTLKHGQHGHLKLKICSDLKIMQREWGVHRENCGVQMAVH